LAERQKIIIDIMRDGLNINITCWKSTGFFTFKVCHLFCVCN